MYLCYLAPNDTRFSDHVRRGRLHSKSKRLKKVISSIEECQTQRSAPALTTLLSNFHDWRTNETEEYASRGGGVAFALWMEAKQLLKNQYGLVANNLIDPPTPGTIPGTMLLGVFVPEAEGHAEMCHGFAYRWAVAAGKVPETLTCARNTAYNGGNMDPVLYPGGVGNYPAARAGGVMQLQPGDIVGMYNGNALGHSLIAESSTVLFSANNAGTFGLGTGRSRIDLTGVFPLGAGWVDNGNTWRRPDNVNLTAIYRRIP